MMNEATTTLWRRAIAFIVVTNSLQLLTQAWPGDVKALLAVAGLAAVGGAVVSMRRVAHPLWMGLSLVGLAAVHELYRATVGNYDDQIFQTAAAGAGWLAGAGFAALAVARDDAGPRRQAIESMAATGAAAGLGAAYLCAGLSKLVESGSGYWIDPTWLRLIALEHQPPDMGALRAWLFDFAVHDARFATLGSTFTIISEVAAVLLPFGRWPRMIGGAGLIFLHVGIWIFTDIVFISGFTLLVVFSFDWPALVARLRGRPVSPPPPEPAVRLRPSHLALLVVVAATVTSVLWALPIERRLHAAPLDGAGENRPPGAPAPPPAPHVDSAP
ncbi:MAG: hypothetical protein R3F39_14295 [Myxococcota bacterium]